MGKREKVVHRGRVHRRSGFLLRGALDPPQCQVQIKKLLEHQPFTRSGKSLFIGGKVDGFQRLPPAAKPIGFLDGGREQIPVQPFGQRQRLPDVSGDHFGRKTFGQRIDWEKGQCGIVCKHQGGGHLPPADPPGDSAIKQIGLFFFESSRRILCVEKK